MYAEKIEIGIDGIVLTNQLKKTKIDWKDVIGVNNGFYRGEIYLKNGCMVKFRATMLFISPHEVFDYGQKKVGDGKPEKINDWGKIFQKVKIYIKERGNVYIDELEWIYSIDELKFSLRRKKEIVLPTEEKKDLKILYFGIFYSFLVILLSMICSLMLKPNRILFNEPFALFFKIILGILVSFWAFFPIYYLRRSKIKNVFERNGISYLPKSILCEVIEDQEKANLGKKRSFFSKVSNILMPK